jgi:hypothetical protein
VAATGGLAAPAVAAKDVTLWVMQPPDQIVRYDVSSFSRIGAVTIPAQALAAPDRFQVNRLGQMLFELDGGGETALGQAWLWNGTAATTTQPLTGPAGSRSRRWLLATNGPSVFTVEHEFRSNSDPNDDLPDSVDTRVRVKESGLDGKPVGTVMDYQFPRCECSTGTCSESCPEAAVWAPGHIVDGFFFLTNWIPGQLGSTYEGTYLYRRDAKGWHATRSRANGQYFLDATDAGDTWTEAMQDGGCCGWTNEGSDQTMLVTRDSSRVLFDEWPRYHNQDYDVSFFTSSARFAPEGRRVAITIGTEAANAEIRLSEDGHPDDLELASIRRSLAELPMVEVYDLRPQPVLLRRVPRVELVGWTSESDLLLVDRGQLVSIDARTGARKESEIHVTGAGRAFLTSR